MTSTAHSEALESGHDGRGARGEPLHDSHRLRQKAGRHLFNEQVTYERLRC